jgi:hypothetical protein
MAHSTFQKDIIYRLASVPRPFAPWQTAQSFNLWKSVKHTRGAGANEADFDSNFRHAESENLYESRESRNDYAQTSEKARSFGLSFGDSQSDRRSTATMS